MYEPAPDVFNGHQSEADVLPLHSKAVEGVVDVRRENADAAVTAFGDILSHFVRIVQHRGQQSRHVFLGIVAFEVGRLIGHHRIAHGVRLVKGVVGKIVYFIVNGLGRCLRYAACNAAPDASLRIAVDEGVPLLLDLLGLFLGNGASNHIRLSE